MARLDRMPAARQIAQIGSTIGRDFSRALLAAVADLPDVVLDHRLEQLVLAGMLFRRGEGGGVTYLFKHALVQDAAYASLLRTRRAALHGAIGAVLEREPETVASDPALLGHHFAQAGDPEKASLYFLRAGEQSLTILAVNEAEAHLTRGLALAAEITSPAVRNRRKAELILGIVRYLQKLGSPVHGATFAEAVALCRILEPRDPASERLLAAALFGQTGYEVFVGHLAKACESAWELFAAVGNSSDPDVRALATSCYGNCCMYLARFAEGAPALAQAVADPDIAARTGLTIDFGFDPYCNLRMCYARMLALQGFPGQARKHLQLALDQAREKQHLPTISLALSIACAAAWIMRDHVALSRWSRALVRIATEQGYGYWQATGRSYAGWSGALEGELQGGLALLDEALRATG